MEFDARSGRSRIIFDQNDTILVPSLHQVIFTLNLKQIATVLNRAEFKGRVHECHRQLPPLFKEALS